MRLYIRLDGAEGGDSLRLFALSKLNAKLEKVDHWVERMEVRVQAIQGLNGSDHACRIVAIGQESRVIAVERRAESPYAAVAQAAERIKELIGRAFRIHKRSKVACQPWQKGLHSGERER